MGFVGFSDQLILYSSVKIVCHKLYSLKLGNVTAMPQDFEAVSIL